jgi:putative colanic acid biosynthesis UDP-glucose lipid carrier transferase
MQQARLNGEGRAHAPLAISPHGILPGMGHVSALPSAPIRSKNVSVGTLDSPMLALWKHWSKPVSVVFALLLALVLNARVPTTADLALAVAAVLLARQVFKPLQLRASEAAQKSRYLRLALEFTVWSAALLLIGTALGLGGRYPPGLIPLWLALAAICLVISDYISTLALTQAQSSHERHIIIGANDVGVELARRISEAPGSGTFLGFFDFRSPDRLPLGGRGRFAGLCKDVVAFVKQHAVNAIYIALPMSNVPRIEIMLQEFRDTTASIYFVPDFLAFELVQARCVEMHGLPMLAICDTPFYGMNAVKKRAIDIMLSGAALLLAWPLMAVIAVGIRISSPGPVLFKQRRYGLHGEEIKVYKFRTMTVCEDGAVVVQARPGDLRVTSIGRMLRRTSLDELPQLFNVLQGRMSFVGPRPHAVAHNELYRKLISGYMIRHKVRPGMTGWAQIHGLRGETPDLEHMRKRVEYDLEYLRNWSVSLDLRVVLKTIGIVFLGSRAY